jgi:hypothetical protein
VENAALWQVFVEYSGFLYQEYAKKWPQYSVPLN